MSANDLIALNNIIKEAHAERAPELSDSDFFEIFWQRSGINALSDRCQAEPIQAPMAQRTSRHIEF